MLASVAQNPSCKSEIPTPLMDAYKASTLAGKEAYSPEAILRDETELVGYSSPARYLTYIYGLAEAKILVEILSYVSDVLSDISVHHHKKFGTWVSMNSQPYALLVEMLEEDTHRSELVIARVLEYFTAVHQLTRLDIPYGWKRAGIAVALAASYPYEDRRLELFIRNISTAYTARLIPYAAQDAEEPTELFRKIYWMNHRVEYLYALSPEQAVADRVTWLPRFAYWVEDARGYDVYCYHKMLSGLSPKWPLSMLTAKELHEWKNLPIHFPIAVYQSFKESWMAAVFLQQAKSMSQLTRWEEVLERYAVLWDMMVESDRFRPAIATMALDDFRILLRFYLVHYDQLGDVRLEMEDLCDYCYAHPTGDVKTLLAAPVTLRSVGRRVTAWHDSLQRMSKEERYHGMILDPLPLDYLQIVRDGICYDFVQLLDYPAFLSETRALRHCVSSYFERCRGGQCEIFSVRVSGDNQESPLLTIETRSTNRQIIQVKGYKNRRPTSTEQSIIREWARNNQLIYRECSMD